MTDRQIQRNDAIRNLHNSLALRSTEDLCAQRDRLVMSIAIKINTGVGGSDSDHDTLEALLLAIRSRG